MKHVYSLQKLVIYLFLTNKTHRVPDLLINFYFWKDGVANTDLLTHWLNDHVDGSLTVLMGLRELHDRWLTVFQRVFSLGSRRTVVENWTLSPYWKIGGSKTWKHSAQTTTWEKDALFGIHLELCEEKTIKFPTSRKYILPIKGMPGCLAGWPFVKGHVNP